MGKMVEDNMLDILRKMSGRSGKEATGAISKVSDVHGGKALIEKAAKAGIDVAANTPPIVPGSKQAKIKALEGMMGAIGKKGLAKGLGKAALGAISGGLSLGAEAFDAPTTGPDPMSEEGIFESLSPRERDMRTRNLERASETMERQDPERDILEKQAFDKRIEDMYPDTRSFEEQEKEAERKLKARKFRSLLESTRR